MPCTSKQKVKQELERLKKQDVITPVLFSDWATPIVPVVKSDENRVCGDYKLTTNKVSKTNRYPLPEIKDIFALLVVVKHFQNSTFFMCTSRSPLMKNHKISCNQCSQKDYMLTKDYLLG